jgi:hypothetical protein
MILLPYSKEGKMSAALKKLLLLSLALVLSFSLVSFAGCKGLPQEEIDRVIAGASAASYDTVSFDIDMPVTIKAKGGSDPGTTTEDMSGTGAIDMVNQTMLMNLGMDITVPDGSSQTVSTEIYVLEGWMYTGMSVPSYDEEWAKIALTEPMWQQQDELVQHLELLETAVEVKYKGTETANGVECYVFEIEPDMATLSDFVIHETSAMGLMNLSGINLTEFCKKRSVREWLAKDSCQLQRAEITVVLEFNPEDVGASSTAFEKVTIDIGMNMRFYAYDQPFTVVLPAGALEAEEIPQSTPEEPSS